MTWREAVAMVRADAQLTKKEQEDRDYDVENYEGNVTGNPGNRVPFADGSGPSRCEGPETDSHRKRRRDNDHQFCIRRAARMRSGHRGRLHVLRSRRFGKRAKYATRSVQRNSDRYRPALVDSE